MSRLALRLGLVVRYHFLAMTYFEFGSYQNYMKLRWNSCKTPVLFHLRPNT